MSDSASNSHFLSVLLCRLYADAYAAGHHDTVEGSYTDVASSDRDNYWIEEVLAHEAIVLVTGEAP